MIFGGADMCAKLATLVLVPSALRLRSVIPSCQLLKVWTFVEFGAAVP